jgi:transcriptional regulator with XRE-family HTH domain
MPPRERPFDRGTRRGLRSITEVGREIRDARVSRSLTQAQVAAACRISQSYEGKIERGEVRIVSVVLLAQLSAVVGLELNVRTFAAATSIRDTAHVELLRRLRVLLHPRWRWRTEVALPVPGDQRAWDAVIALGGLRIGVEAETRVRDIQALDRRIALKLRDGGLDHVLLVLADTRSNRVAIRDFGDALRANFPVPSRVARHALVTGGDLGGSAVLLV